MPRYHAPLLTKRVRPTLVPRSTATPVPAHSSLGARVCVFTCVGLCLCVFVCACVCVSLRGKVGKVEEAALEESDVQVHRIPIQGTHLVVMEPVVIDVCLGAQWRPM